MKEYNNVTFCAKDGYVQCIYWAPSTRNKRREPEDMKYYVNCFIYNGHRDGQGQEALSVVNDADLADRITALYKTKPAITRDMLFTHKCIAGIKTAPIRFKALLYEWLILANILTYDELKQFVKCVIN